MARAKYGSDPVVQTKVKRKGVHSKNKSQKSPGSKNYKKKYRGQGR